MARVVLTFAVDDLSAWKALAAARTATLAPFADRNGDCLPFDRGNGVAVKTTLR